MYNAQLHIILYNPSIISYYDLIEYFNRFFVKRYLIIVYLWRLKNSKFKFKFMQIYIIIYIISFNYFGKLYYIAYFLIKHEL